LAERLRAAVEEQAIHVSGHDKPLHCTVTIGVSPRFASGHALEKAMRAADAALYQGKAAGRNRIEKAHAFADIAPLPGAGASAAT